MHMHTFGQVWDRWVGWVEKLLGSCRQAEMRADGERLNRCSLVVGRTVKESKEGTYQTPGPNNG